MARLRLPLLLTAAAVLAAGCIPGGRGGGQAGGDAPRGCAVVQIASSPEKLDLLTQLAASFNRSQDARSAADGKCAFVKVARVSSGAGADNLARGWSDEASMGPRPTVWSPSASSWGGVVNQRLADRGQPAVVPRDFVSFMLTPLVIAMPEPMARALDYPAKPIGFDDLVTLSQDPAGWGRFGHQEWGAFKLGKTNPNFSTSGLSSTVAQYYTAARKTRDLTLEDVNRPEVAAYIRSIESSVVHYGDTTLTFLNNWYRHDQRGTSLTYVSAVAVEEKSVIDYNRGNPDGVLEQGEKPRPPRVPLVAVYPKDGTLFSDNPLFVLDAPWVSAGQRAGARAFSEFVQREDNQEKVLETGFRPANPKVELDEPVSTANGVDPQQPATTLGVPDPPVLARVISQWSQLRKGAQVLIVLDVSGSMAEEVGGGQTKLDLAKSAAATALDQFGEHDSVGLWIFSTNLSPSAPTEYVEVVPIGPIPATREQMKARIRTLIPRAGTALYTTAVAAHAHVKSRYKPDLINAVVLMTDGRNEDPNNSDLNRTIQALQQGGEGGQQQVRLFTIGFGADADQTTLGRMADATDGRAYDAKDPKAIDAIFEQVISNF